MVIRTPDSPSVRHHQQRALMQPRLLERSPYRPNYFALPVPRNHIIPRLEPLDRDRPFRRVYQRASNCAFSKLIARHQQALAHRTVVELDLLQVRRVAVELAAVLVTLLLLEEGEQLALLVFTQYRQVHQP